MIISLFTLWFCLCSLGVAVLVLEDTSLEIYRPFFQVGNSSQSNYWPTLSPNRIVAVRTQRDVAANITLDLNTVVGVDLTESVFRPCGYNATSLELVSDLLNVGVNSLTLDLYYNNYTQDWGLCPAYLFANNRTSDIISDNNSTTNSIRNQTIQNSSNANLCDVTQFNITSISNIINHYIINTNNVLSTDMLTVLMRLNEISVPSNASQTGITAISNGIVLSNVIPPGSVNAFDFPTLNTILIKLQKRVLNIVVQSNLSSFNPDNNLFYSNSLIDLDQFDSVNSENFINVDYVPIDEAQCLNDTTDVNSTFQFTYDSTDAPYTLETYWQAIQCGFSPIVSHPLPHLDMLSYYLETSLWSWAPFQPTVLPTDLMSLKKFTSLLHLNQSEVLANQSENDLLNRIGVEIVESSNLNSTEVVLNNTVYNYIDDDDSDSDSDEFINRCAVLTDAGWVATSCLQKFKSLCIRKDYPYDLKISNDYSTYINAPDRCSDLGDYKLYVPATAVMQTTAIRLIPDEDDGIWIDLNSLASANCWVVGIDTHCPYQLVVSRKLFAEMMVPSSAMAFFLFVLFILLQFDTPIVLRNRKHWRKLASEIEDPDGKPN